MVVVAEAICTGSLAGHNAARYIANMDYLELPTSLVIGDFIHHSNIEMHEKDGCKKRFTFAGSIYFNRMKDLGFYTIEKDIISKRVENVDLINIYNKKIIN
ncbi:MAG: hypothetical protein RSC26_03180 [Terrisporobacter sp.]